MLRRLSRRFSSYCLHNLHFYQRHCVCHCFCLCLVLSVMPAAIEMYTKWTLESMTPVSKHSALYHFVSKDRKRGTPHPRGSGRRPSPNTWHTTLLAEVGPNAEGPPWIERDYTPISTAKQWEQGQVDILVKIYPQGFATSWLRTAPKQVWLFKPVRTLSVPGLVTDKGGDSEFQPASVLLLLAGTGVVALPQILHHRDPLYKLGMSTPRRQQLRVPIDAVLSFREDDVLCLPQIAEACCDKKCNVRNCTLLLTAKNEDPPIFPESSDIGDLAEVEKVLHDIPNARVMKGTRLNATIVAEAIARMPQPCRVVVSGPDGFNSASRQMLADVIDEKQVTILSA